MVCVCVWQLKLCDPLVTHGPYLSALEVWHDEPLYKFTFTLLYFTETLTDRLTHGETTSDNIAHEQLILYHLCSQTD